MERINSGVNGVGKKIAASTELTALNGKNTGVNGVEPGKERS